jgi:hypothetical protein
MQQQLVQSIKTITQDGEPIIYSNLSIDKSFHMYDSKKKARWRMMIDDTYLSKKDKYVIGYRCLTCNSFNEVSSLRFLRKLNSDNMAFCYTCRNQNEEKRLRHSVFMTGKDIRNLPPKESVHVMNNVELHEHGMKLFEGMDMCFQTSFAQSHLMDDDMQRIMPQIVSLRNGKISNSRLTQCTYWPIFPCSNQMKYTSVFYDSGNDEVIKLDQPIMKCEQCYQQWKAKNLHKLKNDIRILCKDCKLCRKTFKIRGFDTKFGDRITYQSRQEKHFIDWCEDNRIALQNGPNIPYMFNGSAHTYKVDFAIPSLGILIEVKDDHIWHKQQVASGKWDAKLLGVDTYIQTHLSKYQKYLMLTPKTKKNVCQEILSRLNKI